MKNKPTRHKESNTFRFQPFSERIANVDIDIFHRVGHEYEQEEENESLFHQAVAKWDVLNLTDHYSAFRKEVQAQNLVTLPQLIHNKDHVVQVLVKHLKYKEPLCLQALLELVVALVNDLRKDFYPYYAEFLSVIVDLLNTKDTDQLEWSFTCLAYFFKFLWRPLTKDMNTVFLSLLPLLSDSKPPYINNFAAESFAFVVRKIRDHESFLGLILKVVKTKQDGITGCGKLLFEVLKGVGNQFHSCSDTFLPFLLSSLANKKFPQGVLFEILEEVVRNVALGIHPHKGELFWKTCVESLENFSGPEAELVLKLVGQAIELKNGKFLQVPVLVVQALTRLLSRDPPPSTLLIVSQISVLILLSPSIRLPQEQASHLIREVLSVPDKKVLLHFVEHTADYTSFEALILPHFLKCFGGSSPEGFEGEELAVLVKILDKKSPLSLCGINLGAWVRYPLDFGSKERNAKVFNFVVENLRMEDGCSLRLDETYVYLVVLLPHLTYEGAEEAKRVLEGNIALLCEKIRHKDEELKRLLFLLLITLESYVKIAGSADLLPLQSFDPVLGLTTDVNMLSSLRILDLYLSAVRTDSVICEDTLKQLHAVLQGNFSSAFHEVRLLTAHIYSLFEAALHPDWRLFTLCLEIEQVQPQVETYREQLQNLEKLSFEKHDMALCPQEFRTAPLRYLLGVLYMNFRLLWEPAIQVITTHAQGLDTVAFWGVFGEELKGAAASVREPPRLDDGEWELVGDLYRKVYGSADKPDFANRRLLLWKALAGFPEIAEAKTRDVSELLLNFIENEYVKSNSDLAVAWNIKQNSRENVEGNNDEDGETTKDAEAEVKTEDAEIKKELLKQAPVGKTSSNFKALQHHLAVFTKIRSPKSMYREGDLSKLYLDLLSHKSHEVQKLALDCLMTYKPKYLVPYRESLYTLIDEKNFKDALATFRVDTDSAVLAEHRPDLIPVVMKIVHGKMFAKTGLRTGGKSSGQLRRNLVLRFLAGCKEGELLGFVNMAFRFYARWIEEDVVEMATNVSKNVDLERFVPPKRLQSGLNLLTVIVEQLGGLMGEDLLRFLLKVLFVISAMVKGALDQSSSVHGGYLATLKSLRSSAVKIVEKFFGHFESYPWTPREIDAVFQLFVWPSLEKLPVEGIHSPTPLLKLFVQWGSNPKYFPLLMKSEGEDYPLPHIMKLLLQKQCHGSVVNTIMEMVEKMLSLAEDAEDGKLAVDNLIPIKGDVLEKLKLKEINYGSCALLPHVSPILEVIKRKLKFRSVSHRELFILSRVSELVWEASISDEVLNLLIPVIIKKATLGEEAVLKYTTTLGNLLKNVQAPQSHIDAMSPLFGEVSFVSCRKILCGTLEEISKQDETLTLAAGLIKELNAFDAKWVDQPNYERRLTAFKRVQTLINEGSIDRTSGVIIIYNCYYTIRHENDLSLREYASDCWKNVSAFLVGKDSNLLDDVLFSLIRKGFKSKNSELRNGCILLLGHLARECPDAHPILRDLNKLTNKADVEVDFFENITHLQTHRHVRALLKACQTFKKEDTVAARTLTQFVLPLATFYLCTERYAQKNSLVDAAIQVVAVVSRLLSWQRYEGLLKFYLGKLRQKFEFQRQLVRILVAIMDAFHFDLSKGQMMKPKELEQVKESAKDQENKEKQGGTMEEQGEPKEEQDEVKEAKIDEDKQHLEDKDEEEYDEQSPSDDEKDSNEAEAADTDTGLKILCQSTATRVIRTIQLVLLPQLHRTMAEMTHYETSHKVNRKKTGFEREEEDLQRVPISLAVVKLLQRLPKEIMDSNLPGVFMKLCTFLRSQLDSVRRTARETLQKIMQILGPDYLSMLLDQMSSLLSRGYQVHVLIFTVHAVLVCLKALYKPGMIDKVLLPVLDLCQIDLFGMVAEEKEVVKIGRKVSEAKARKSYDVFQILAKFTTEKCFMDLVLPLKNVLASSHSFKTVNKAQEALRHVALGLVENTFVSFESLFKFAYGTSSESIPQLLPSSSVQEEKKAKQPKKPDCFIIAPAPVGRSGFRKTGVKHSSNANAHVLVEFGLRLVHFLLKKDKVKSDEYAPFMDPFVGVFKNCLASRHVKLSMLTLNCLARTMKHDLPSMRENIEEITEAMFAILHKYAAAGLSKGDNFELVMAAFKAMAVLVRDVKYHTITTSQLKVLLLYAEQDLHNYERQATAFALLKAIMARKLMAPQMQPVMQKVAELSVTSELPHVRLQARLAFHQYVMDYPLGKKLEKHVAFYISQLSYEVQSGRESAIEMIQTFVNSFPVNILKEHSGTFLVTLGARLVNEEVAECRKKIADCISAMYKRLSKSDVDPLFDIIILWLRDKKKSHKQLAAQLCGLLVACEKSSFEERLDVLTPVILTQFGLGSSQKPGKFVLLQAEAKEIDSRIQDHHLFQVLQLLLKISSHCPVFLKRTEDIQALADHVQTLLGYPHEWVRLGAAQFLGHVLNSIDVQKLATLLVNNETEDGYLSSDPFEGIKALTLDLCAQLQPGIKSDLAEQVVKNLVYVARVLQRIPKDEHKISLLWLAKRLRKIVNMEVVEDPTSTVLRMEVFKWIGGVGTVLEVESVVAVLPTLLAPLVREMITTEESNAPLRQLSKEVGNLIKKRVGIDLYTSTLSKVEQRLAVKRSERKRDRKQLAVTDPEMFAKKKIKTQEKKKENRKRKLKTKTKWKKRRKVDEI